MKCLMKYKWVKLPRRTLPQGRGIMGYWAKLASRAAFRKGRAYYCGYTNEVVPGMWSGGTAGLKSILGVKKRYMVFEILDRLSGFDLISYEYDEKTKKLSYSITDWVIKCSGPECTEGNVYATQDYGFLCLPRNITQKLIKHRCKFEETDALLDLWCHSVSEDPDNAFSFLAPTVQLGSTGAVLTLETLGRRWNWEKTKVWRFFRKYRNAFALYRLPGSCGCLIFNRLYPTDTEVSLPSDEEIVRIVREIRILCADMRIKGSENKKINRTLAVYSRIKSDSHGISKKENRVALSDHIIRAYFSLCRNTKNYNYDCIGYYTYTCSVNEKNNIRGPCRSAVSIKKQRRSFTYEQ